MEETESLDVMHTDESNHIL